MDLTDFDPDVIYDLADGERDDLGSAQERGVPRTGDAVDPQVGVSSEGSTRDKEEKSFVVCQRERTKT